MYLRKIDIEDNFSYYNDVITYYYKIKPINSLFASDKQLSILIQLLKKIILDVNMPGEIIIKPKLINNDGIINYHKELYNKYGREELDILHKSLINDLSHQVSRDMYRYEIFFLFTDGREELRKKKYRFFKDANNCEMNDDIKRISLLVSNEIQNKLSSDIQCDKLNEKEITDLLNYLAIPKDNLIDYYVKPTASSIEYNYKEEGDYEYRDLLTRTLIVSSIDMTCSDENIANVAINKLQQFPFPVDTILKFELEHTYKFKNHMRSKRETIRKSRKRYLRDAERDDTESKKAYELSAVAQDVDESIEESKIRFQVMFRIKNTNKQLLESASDQLIKFMSSYHLNLTYELGEQEALSNNLFADTVTFKKYTNLSDIVFFSKFNLLGGLFIGEEKEGVITSFVRPGQIPVLLDLEASMKGKAKSSSTTTIFTGETGSGKSQISNYQILLSLVFYGHKVLVVDPKNDRKPLVEYLNQYGNVAKTIVVGGDSCPSGIFDPFLIHRDNDTKALQQAKNDITQMSRAININDRISLTAIDNAFNDMKILLEKNEIKRYSLTILAKLLIKYDPTVADNLLGLKDDANARLFFSTDDTDISYAFDMSYPYNLITFDKLPIYDKENKISYNDNSLEHKMFSIVLSKIHDLAANFMRTDKNKAKSLQIDEVRVFSACPGGIEVITQTNLMARSALTNLHLLLQNWSELPESTINNTSTFFIGNMKSQKEISLVLEHFKLENNSYLKSVLEDSTKEEGLNEDKKYNFLFCDYNNRKCVTKMNILPTLIDAFNTYKKE